MSLSKSEKLNKALRGVLTPAEVFKVVPEAVGTLLTAAAAMTVETALGLKPPSESLALNPMVLVDPAGPATNAHSPISPIGIGSISTFSVCLTPLRVRYPPPSVLTHSFASPAE